MLKTSMEGGLSRDIQKSLRDYLLSEDTGLRSRIREMRDNLDQCRITRRKVQETLVKRASIEEVLGPGSGCSRRGFTPLVFQRTNCARRCCETKRHFARPSRHRKLREGSRGVGAQTRRAETRTGSRKG